jgi:hypothetical protein
MATERQIAANRRNAQKSSGPRTPEGKARSSRNHLLHGLTSQGLLPGEDPEALAAIHNGLCAQFLPQGPAEEILIERMASAHFRLARFPHVEAQLLQRWPADPSREKLLEKHNGKIPVWDDKQPYDQVTRNFVENGKQLHLLGVYESRLERTFDRALRDLLKLQANRPLAPAPAEVSPEPEANPQPQLDQSDRPPIGFECSNTAPAPTLATEPDPPSPQNPPSNLQPGAPQGQEHRFGPERHAVLNTPSVPGRLLRYNQS